jgi:uncharacterized protein with ATP-grasp and redox domains
MARIQAAVSNELESIADTVSPPVLAGKVHSIIREYTGVTDPYISIKDRCNDTGRLLMREARTMIADAAPENRIMTAVKIATLGNLIDFGVGMDESEMDVYSRLHDCLSTKVIPDHSDILQSQLKEAKSIVYLADNAGEFHLDLLLMEMLSHADIHLVVRGEPVLNDISVQDLDSFSFSSNIKIHSNESGCPGTDLDKLPTDVKNLINQSDVVISKGQGNFETLYARTNANIFYLLKAKCQVLAELLCIPRGTSVILSEKEIKQ